MDFKRFLIGASCSWGVILFALGVSRGDSIALSSAPLTAATTGVIIPEEPFMPPLRGAKVPVVSGFGKRQIQGQPKPEMHEGVDYAVEEGTEVHASRSGRVIFAGFSKMYVSRTDKDDQHRLVIILHPDGKSTRYVHLIGLRVRPGQEVQSGQPLGVVSESDEWTSPVLHFEIRDAQGRAMNPLPILEGAKKP